MSPEKLLSIWTELAEAPPSAAGLQRIRLDIDAAADIFACIFWPSRCPGLLIEGEGAHRPAGDRIPTCRGVRMIHEILPGTEPRTLLRVMLEEKDLSDIFAVMSADLVAATAAQPSAASALRRCIDRLCMWQGLFEKIPPEGLSEEKQRGLLGELLVLETLFLPRMSEIEAVDAWTGPDPAHQDFILGGLAVEVKTSMAKRHARIQIANEKQLDDRPHEVLLLAFLRLDESAAHGDSLPAAVARVRQRLGSAPGAAQALDDRLAMSGYLDVHAPRYVRNRWQCSERRYFRVEGDFPRLTEANLPAGVGDIRYSIIADDLGEHEILEDEVAAIVGETDG
jgi:hypothetical protein